MDESIYILAVVTSGGILGVAHFALHPEVTGYKLPRPTAYIIGVGTIGAVTTWLGLVYAATPAQVVTLFWFAVWGATFATLGGRALRDWVNARHAVRERDELIRKARGEE